MHICVWRGLQVFAFQIRYRPRPKYICKFNFNTCQLIRKWQIIDGDSGCQTWTTSRLSPENRGSLDWSLYDSRIAKWRRSWLKKKGSRISYRPSSSSMHFAPTIQILMPQIWHQAQRLQIAVRPIGRARSGTAWNGIYAIPVTSTGRLKAYRHLSGRKIHTRMLFTQLAFDH